MKYKIISQLSFIIIIPVCDDSQYEINIFQFKTGSEVIPKNILIYLLIALNYYLSCNDPSFLHM